MITTGKIYISQINSVIRPFSSDDPLNLVKSSQYKKLTSEFKVVQVGHG